MNTKKNMQQISKEIMHFMRGKYASDEVGNGVDELKFISGGEAWLTIHTHERAYEFLMDTPEGHKKITVADGETWETVKRLILEQKKPDRLPFPKEQAIYSDCGHRCDLCIHYNGGTISEDFRRELKERLHRIYEADLSGESSGWGENMPLCEGCAKGGYGGEGHPCEQKKCADAKGAARCSACQAYPCDHATAGYNNGVEARSMSADDITWAILPFVEGQYGN